MVAAVTLFRCPTIAVNYIDAIMSAMASQITGVSIIYSNVYSGADQIKHQSCTSVPFVKGIHRSPVNSAHKGSVARKKVSIWWRQNGRLTCVWWANGDSVSTESLKDAASIVWIDGLAAGCFLSRNLKIHSRHWLFEAETKWPPFRRRHFQTHFLEWKY